jgi:hypothetical protein
VLIYAMFYNLKTGAVSHSEVVDILFWRLNLGKLMNVSITGELKKYTPKLSLLLLWREK